MGASFESIIDIMAFSPFFLEPILDKALPSLGVLRILRLVRLMKANKMMQACRTVARVLYFNAQIMIVTLTVCGTLVLVTATLLYYLHNPENNNAEFASIPATTYLSIMMLTGQGGPEGEMSVVVKVVCACTAFASVALFALPSSMLTWAFEAEAERLMQKAHDKEKRKKEKQAECLED